MLFLPAVQTVQKIHYLLGNRPMSIAEKALHELDVYKTPLLPTRLKSSTSVPDIFKPKKAHYLILMQDKDGSARLGVPSNKKSKKNRINGTKPYAGEGGMKKLLARRKMEEEEEKDTTVGTGGHSEATDGESKSLKTRVEGRTSTENAGSHKKESEPPNRSSNTDRSSEVVGGRPQSSLRVGRTKINRSHLTRPPRPANRFSARYADEDGDDQMQDDTETELSKEQLILEEAAKKVPVFEIKPGFTFAKESVGVLTFHLRRPIVTHFRKRQLSSMI